MIASAEVLDREYTAYGGAVQLMEATETEVACVSGAGSGKSFSLMWKANYTARAYPGCRQFFARDTRKSMNESILPDWESKILWPGHPAITGTATKEHRDSYTYPNGSVIVLIGLDNVDRVMSAQFDRGYVFEATEITENDWDRMLTRLRNGKTPYHQLVADCNPAGQYHWINQRFEPIGSHGRRIQYHLSDNPMWYDHARHEWKPEAKNYIDILYGLTPVNRERLLYSRWVSEEGAIWPEFDDSCMVYAKDVPKIVGYAASVDFGDAVPTAFQVWGVDDKDRAYRVAEIYQAGLSQDQLAFGVNELWKRYPFPRGVADCADPRFIRFLNDKIGEVCGRHVDRVFIPCEKKAGKLAGLSHTRDMFRQGKIKFVKNANWHVATDPAGKMHLAEGIDQKLKLSKKPTCTEQEIPGYVWLKNTDGDPIREKPDPSRPNDGCDATEYFAMWKWRKEIESEPLPGWRPPPTEPGKIKFAEASGLMDLMEKENWDWKVGD